VYYFVKLIIILSGVDILIVFVLTKAYFFIIIGL